MKLNRQHRNYDLAMELACLVSTTPVPIDDVKSDLELERQSDVNELIGELGRRGYEVRHGNRDGKRCVWVSPNEYRRLIGVAGEYYDDVYKEPEPKAEK